MPPTDPARLSSPWPRRLVFAGLLALTVASAAAAAAAWWLWSTVGGLQVVLRAVNALVPVRVEATGTSGSLRDGFAFDRLHVIAGNTVVDIERLHAQLQSFGVSPWRFDFTQLGADRVTAQVTPGGEPGVPDSIASPVVVTTARLSVGTFALKVGATPLEATRIEAQVALGPEGYRVTGGRFAFGANRATIDGHVDGRKPFAVDARATLQTSLDATAVSAQLTASGNLVDLTARAAVSGGGAAGELQAQVASFDTPTLKSLRAALSGVDPRAWHPQAPRADLRIEANLVPAAGEGFVLRGPVSVINHAAGPIDLDRIPLRALRTAIEWHDHRLRLDDFVAELARGRARGTAAFESGPRPSWQVDMRFDAIDPSLLHSRLRPLQLDGTARLQRADDVDHVIADLINRDKLPARLNIDLRATPQQVVLNAGRLSIGQGRAEFSGEMQRAGAQTVRASGTVANFEPALLVRGLDARINGRFEFDGRLQPQPAGRVRFEIADSTALGRPLAGQGVADLDADNNLDVDLQLSVRSARLQARGGLGGARTLAVSAEVPALEELALPVSGAMKAEATLRGAWTAPAVEARIEGMRLSYAEHRIESLRALVNYGGGDDGAVALRAEISSHRFRQSALLSLRSANLAVEGRLSQHRLTLAANSEKGEPLAVAAAGGWNAGTWRGEITQASAGRPLDLRLVGAAPLVIDGAHWSFGPAALTLAGANVEQLRVAADGRGITTAGRFNGLRPVAFAAESPVRDIVVQPAQSPPLELRGEWTLRLADLVDGELLVERSGGDLYAATYTMGLRELRLQATLRASQLEAEALLDAERAGIIRASMRAAVERRGKMDWGLAQARPWSAAITAHLPAIEGINPLLSDRVRANVRLGGQLDARVLIDGTPGAPRASGTLRGDKLRAAWIDQGVRFDNGTLAARLDGETIILDELRFTGAPHVRPQDKRAAAAAGDRPGFISANGQLKLRDFSGVIQVAAQRLPLLQRNDRWVIASGGANIEMSKRRVQVNAAVNADAGYINFTRGDLPRLSDDVVVYAPGDALRAREPGVQFGFDLGIDLGRAFYLRGSGLDTRVIGAVRLRSEGKGVVRATGAVEAREGTYEGFGQKLAIERGRVNFQGAPENPGLDILAVRKGLPVEVGVSIGRTATNPLIRLYSDQTMADFEILSWLVLGRPADQTRADNAALVNAAAGLLSGSGEGIPSTLARRLGIDEISVRTGQVRSVGSLLPRQSVAGSLRGADVTTATGEILTIGKRLNDALTISYEQAFAGATNAVQLSYQLSRRISLVARAGRENTLDLVFSFAFD